MVLRRCSANRAGGGELFSVRRRGEKRAKSRVRKGDEGKEIWKGRGGDWLGANYALSYCKSGLKYKHSIFISNFLYCLSKIQHSSYTI